MHKITNPLFARCAATLLVALASISGQAATVEYQFSGLLSGYTQSPLIGGPSLSSSPAWNLQNVPFIVSIIGDTNNISRGYSMRENAGVSATWTLAGYDTSTSSQTMVMNDAYPGFGFVWSGQSFTFSGSVLTLTDLLATPISPTPINSLTSLYDPTRLPSYFVNVAFPNIGSLTLTSMSGMTYSVITPVPEPNSWALMISGLGLIAGLARRADCRIGACR